MNTDDTREGSMDETHGGRAGSMQGGRAPWVLVAGGFHRRGGMDKANAALATYLVGRGTPVHLVAHHVAHELAARAGVTVHEAARPAGSFLLGERLLARRGREVARRVTARWPGARVLVNGGNCVWPDINWVHSVHRAWPPADGGAPRWFKLKNRLTGALARGGERRAILCARVVIANSERTRRDLIRHLGLDPERVRALYLGSDEAHGAVTAAERAEARRWLSIPEGRLLVVFAGALGHDQNKGFDTLWAAWESLCARGGWDADLLVAGEGRGLGAWRARVASAGLGGRVRLLGFTERLSEVYAAADLLVSPVRYEAYGLNVHEAICRGVPALVSGRAGVAERYPAELREMILPNPEDADDLARRLRRWSADPLGWKERFAPLAAVLRRHTWEDMARQLVAFVEGGAGAPAENELAACPA